MYRLPRMISNRVIANKTGIFLLSHHTSCIQARFVKSLYRKRNSIIKVNIPIIKCGYSYSQVSKMFEEIYNIKVIESDKDMIKARISWVQSHEPITRRGIEDNV